MKILAPLERIEVYLVKLPLVTPFATSFGVETHKEALLLKITCGGVVGWGECVASPAPFYSSETNQTALHILKDFLIPVLKTVKELSIEDVLTAFSRVRGHTMAKAALENALLDLLARRREIPLYKLLGGTPKKIMSGISIGIKASPTELVEAISQALQKKYHRVKMKIKQGRDLEYIAAVRREFPKIDLMVDANSAYSLDDLDLLAEFDRFRLTMIEQPLDYDDIYLHSLAQKRMQTPLCLDESIKSLRDARAAVQLGSCKVINIKQGRVGGMLEAAAIARYCRDHDIGAWSGGMLETGIGRGFNLHLQTLPGFNLPGDTSATSRYFKEDVVTPPVELDKDGYISIPGGVGTGVRVLEDRVERWAVYWEKLL